MTDAGKERHIPIRMCAICRKRRPKAELERFITGQGSAPPLADPRQVLPGRGVYVCASGVCREKFIAKSVRKCKGV